jgi:hypothetical protein
MIPYKKYVYTIDVNSTVDFFRILKQKFNINESSGVLIRNIDKPYEIIVNGNTFVAEKNVNYIGGDKGPKVKVYGYFDEKNQALELVLKFDLYWRIAFTLFGLFMFIYSLIDGVSLPRALFSTFIFLFIIYLIALVIFHVNEERFPMNFEKRLRKYIKTKKTK